MPIIQTIGFIEISIEAGILLGGKRKACSVQSFQMKNLAQPIILILSIRSQFDVHGALEDDKVKQ